MQPAVVVAQVLSGAMVLHQNLEMVVLVYQVQ
jgi:hypothetical protein